MEIVVAICLVAAVMVVAFLWSPRGAQMRQRLDELASAEVTPREIMLQKSFLERGLAPFIRFLAEAARAFTPETQRMALLRSLQQAGFNRRYALEVLLAFKAFALLLGAVVVWVLAGTTPAITWSAGLLVAAVGLCGPTFWLSSRISRRKASIVRSLPQVVDLVTACVEAGMSFDAAVQHVVPTLSEADAPLRDELAMYLADVGMGQSRQDALGDLAARCGVDELQGLVAAVLQGDQLGQGIGTTLRAQSVHLRMRRRQRAQEEAMKAPVKMLVPLVFFVFPAMFVVILGPAVLQLTDVLGSMAKNMH